MMCHTARPTGLLPSPKDASTALRSRWVRHTVPKHLEASGMYETLFWIAGFATPVWLVLIFLPRWRASAWLARSMAAPIFLAALYVWGVGALIAEHGLGFMRDFGSVEGVTRLLTDPAIAIVAWIHILAFDHAVGIMIYRENMERRYVSLPVQSMMLAFTFILGPVGFVSYWLVRAQRRYLMARRTSRRCRTPVRVCRLAPAAGGERDSLFEQGSALPRALLFPSSAQMTSLSAP